MKKIYLLIAIAITATSVYAQNFTPDNLVLFRHNLEGTTSGGTATSGKNTNGTKSVQIFLDEYKLATDGNSLELVQTLPLYDDVNGTNNPITTFGWDNVEGYMTRSYDGRYLIVPGYGVQKGTELASTYATNTAGNRSNRDNVQKTVAVIDYQKNINSQTLLPSTLFSNRAFSGATSYDGTDLWLSGGWGVNLIDGPYYAEKGGTTAVNLLSDANRLYGSREIKIFNNQLYAVEGFTSAASSNAFNFHKIGEGLPKTNSPENVRALQNLNVTAAFMDMRSIFIAKLPNGKVVVYTANSHTNGQHRGIRKYSQKADGTFINNYTNSGEPRGVGMPGYPVSIEGKVDPSGKVTLYIVTSSLNVAGGDSKVFVIEDESGHSETAGAAPISGTPKLLLDLTGQNKQFRSIALAPVQNSVLPIKLSSFDAKYRNNQVNLNWKTSSENNNSHFEILRSEGSEFKVIGTLKGAGDSATEHVYNFTDHNPLSGVSYYQLRQIDFDGSSELSKIIPVSVEPKQTELKIFVNYADEAVINIYTVKGGDATLEIKDILGRTVLTQDVVLANGYNSFGSHMKLTSGLYVATLRIANEVTGVKFLK